MADLTNALVSVFQSVAPLLLLLVLASLLPDLFEAFLEVPLFDEVRRFLAPMTSFDEQRIAKAKLVENERWKYLATFLNTVAAAVITIGVVTPAALLFWKPPWERVVENVGVTLAGVMFWIGAAAILHIGASACLGKLKA